MDTFKILGLSKTNREKQSEKLREESEFRKMYKVTHSYMQSVLQKDIDSELREVITFQKENKGGYHKIYPI
jgi:hypothetical protein